MQGVPSYYSLARWDYGTSSVYLSSGKVSGWQKGSVALQVSLPNAGTRGGSSFSIGSSMTDVAAVQGVPSYYSVPRWDYGTSGIYFSSGTVSGWQKGSVALQVSLANAGSNSYGSFGIGSSTADVAAVQGVPSYYSFPRWHYGTSSVYFSGGNVTGWQKGSVALHLSGDSTVSQDSTTVAPVAPVVVPNYNSGCGSRGGPGYRLPSGKCASWRN
jgi:hypothetical protein